MFNFLVSLKWNKDTSAWFIRSQVIWKAYDNTGSFNQNIQLQDIQAGLYLVSVYDDAKQVKKVVIN
jgi:hypothetical protein